MFIVIGDIMPKRGKATLQDEHTSIQHYGTTGSGSDIMCRPDFQNDTMMLFVTVQLSNASLVTW